MGVMRLSSFAKNGELWTLCQPKQEPKLRRRGVHLFELNPIKLIRGGVNQSRLLKVLFLVACLGWFFLGATLVLKPLNPTIALIIVGFHLGTWYFALATRSALYFVLGLNGKSSQGRAATLIDCICYGIILFCQILFLVTVLRVSGSS
ncbi:MAG: hypothetical protein ACI97A_002262 [Planctomycetota bacterium]|jgi:hypothetical protein